MLICHLLLISYSIGSVSYTHLDVYKRQIFNRALLRAQTGDYRGAIKDYTTVIDVYKRQHIDYALLLDGLKAEREQGITIDVAYRYFCLLYTSY